MQQVFKLFPNFYESHRVMKLIKRRNFIQRCNSDVDATKARHRHWAELEAKCKFSSNYREKEQSRRWGTWHFTWQAWPKRFQTAWEARISLHFRALWATVVYMLFSLFSLFISIHWMGPAELAQQIQDFSTSFWSVSKCFNGILSKTHQARSLPLE